MTGFGKAEATSGNKKVSIEIRCLNARQLDLNLRIPHAFREKELVFRQVLAERIKRGKVDVYITIETTGEEQSVSIRRELVKAYYKELQQVSQELNHTGSDLLSLALKMPEVTQAEKEVPDAAFLQCMHDVLLNALNEFEAFRKQEGNVTSAELHDKVKQISHLLIQTESYEKERINKVTERLKKAFTDLPEEVKPDANRFEQELIFYLEKFDISEEKSRLANHCSYFIQTLEADSEAGRKLGFIAQEMGREINTLGSKANHAEMQKCVVQMKDLLEQIKEQLLNIL